MNPYLRDYILKTRPVCECCGDEPSTQINHCLKHAVKGKHPVPQFQDIINLEAVGEKCHITGKCHTHAHKLEFKKIQEARFWNVDAWIAALPYPHNIDRL